MSTENMNSESVYCRWQSAEFAGKPEAEFLLRVASSFDELARRLTHMVSGADALVHRKLLGDTLVRPTNRGASCAVLSVERC
jgi:hypothetical protein